MASLEYHRILIRFTTFSTCEDYAIKIKMSSDEELVFITPEYIYKFMTLYDYGRVDPSVEDNPVHGHGSTLRYWKKVLSYFMPNKRQRWTSIGEIACGNPTKSSLVKNLLKALERNPMQIERLHQQD